MQVLNLKIENEIAYIDFSEELVTAPDSPGGTLGTVSYTHLDVYKRQG